MLRTGVFSNRHSNDSGGSYNGSELERISKMANGGLKEFLLRGNVVDLAVGVVVGGAFGGVVAALTKDLLTPLIAAIAGKPDFSALQFQINGSKFLVGDFINSIVAFILVAASVYYFVVVPVNALMARNAREPAPADPTTKKCPECLSDVAIKARRCAFCTSQLA